ncbi:hypothetical protein GH714_002045 [Hevea brasiliensis]|uniref:Uncharacterized protein n=1 Tax=Hevea brasiliensis TaxID=3981 RepID=A0A6A6L869_HEVBR|nr:hypothetical protein GH714_002045 [Hevea brasiliensis]
MVKDITEQGSFSAKDYHDPPPAPLIDATDPAKTHDACGGVGILGIAWAFGGMIFILVYCTAGISGGHINPAVTFGLFLARKISLVRAVMYMVAQCLGAIAGVGLVKAFQSSHYKRYGGGANSLANGTAQALDWVPRSSWIFWVGPFAGAAIAAFYHQFILRAGAVKALGSFRSNPSTV